MRFSVVSVSTALLASCAAPTWQPDYLTTVVNRATQENILRRFGEPDLVRESGDGSVAWTYRYYHLKIVSFACDEYVLSFDRTRTLREWRQQDCVDELR
jgi:hypothetical protein